MLTLFVKFLRAIAVFAKNTLGCIQNPYITYRTLSEETHIHNHVFVVYAFVIAYFTFASLVREGFSSPYFLTLKFNSLFVGSILIFGAMVGTLFSLGKLFRGKGTLQTIITLWSYTLLPTLVWFFSTSMLYLVLPPPRTISVLGKTYSIVYISFSIAVLLWKLILYYLTLRFGMKIDLIRIIVITIIIAPIIGLYSILLYRFGIFRIPFI